MNLRYLCVVFIVDIIIIVIDSGVVSSLASVNPVTFAQRERVC